MRSLVFAALALTAASCAPAHADPGPDLAVAGMIRAYGPLCGIPNPEHTAELIFAAEVRRTSHEEVTRRLPAVARGVSQLRPRDMGDCLVISQMARAALVRGHNDLYR